MKLLGLVTPALAIVLGMVLKIGLLAGVGAVAYLLILLTAMLLRVSRDPRTGYGFHIQFRQGHRGDIEHFTGMQDRDEKNINGSSL